MPCKYIYNENNGGSYDTHNYGQSVRLTMDYAKELNIDIMPLTVRFGEDDFKCGIDLTNEAFYDKLTNDSNNPSTAAVNPFELRKFSKNTSMPAMKSWQSSFPNT